MTWRRRTWMTLAAGAAMSAVAVLAVASLAMARSESAELVKTAASFQFTHAMASFACATIMQIGGAGARRAPALFLGGSTLFCGPLYAVALGAPAPALLLAPVGVLGLLAGWFVLARAAASVDPAGREATIPGRHGLDNLMRIPTPGSGA